MSIQVATLRITTRCMHSCKCCFAPKNVPEMDLPRLQRVFDVFVGAGVQNVLLTGGEPLLRDDFTEIVLELKRRGFGIFLDTGGDLFFKYADVISRHISVLGLSMDWIGGGYRGASNFKRVLEILTYYRGKRIRPEIRIGTVVTQDNYLLLEKIGECIAYYPVFAWKLYQFLPQGINAIGNRKQLEVSEAVFRETAGRIRTRFASSLNVVISNRRSRSSAYFFIESDGRVVMPVDNGDIGRMETIGDIFDKNIFEKWTTRINRRSYVRNLKPTFNI